MIKRIPSVSFSGAQCSPYSIQFSGGGNEKSELTMVFIDRNGNYDIDSQYTRSTGRPVSVTIGSFFKFTGYIVSAETDESPGRSTLTVKLWDSSIILDKYDVRLKGLQGPGFTTFATGEYGNTIFVGTQVDPCQDIPPNYPDPCAPNCTETTGGKENYNCLEEKQLKILEVDYSFPELQAAVAGVVKFGAFPSAVNTEYRANYTGSLREVIKNWCQDFAIDFYWADNAIYFFDLKAGITINDSSVANSPILSKKRTLSIEDNQTQGNIIYFGADGEKREYSCTRNSSKRLTLRPITLYDILADNDDVGSGKPGYSFLVRNYDPHLFRLTVAVQQLFDSIVLNYYSEAFRNLYVLFEREDLDTAAKMYAFSQNAAKKAIPTLGNLKPTTVCYVLPDGTGQNAGLYTTLLRKMDVNEQVDFVKRGGYFMAA